MSKDRRDVIHQAARTLGAEIETELDKAIMDAAIDEAVYLNDPGQTDAMNTALSAVADAKQAWTSSKETVIAIKHTEREK